MANDTDAEFAQQLRAMQSLLVGRGQKTSSATTSASSARPPAKTLPSKPGPSKPAAVRSNAPTNRINGRLVREPLTKLPSAPSSSLSGPTTSDFRRKVQEMERGEASALRVLPRDRSTLDVPPVIAPPSPAPSLLNFAPGDLIRSFVFAEIFGKPKSRR